MSAQAPAAIQSEAQRAYTAGAEAWEGGRIDLAAAGFGRAALLLPNWAQAHANLGVALRRLGCAEAAVASYTRALVLEPDQAATLSNLGNALRDLGRLAEAERALSRAVELEPQSRGYVYNLALLLRDRRRHRESLEILDRLSAAEPGNAEYRWDCGLSHLYLGDYARGFAGYEARLELARNPARVFPSPRWTGADPRGLTLLVASEQGFGDALQFIRFVPLLAGRGAAIVLECLPEQMELFTGLPGVTAVFAKGEPPPAHDAWVPLASLPHCLGCTPETLPVEVPYLRVPDRPHLRLIRSPGTRLAVGLIWAGKTTPRDRSWPLEELMPLLGDPGIAFHSLQLGPRATDLARLGVERLVRDPQGLIQSFADTAALMAQLDLVITIDTAAAHLAGALGRPVWVLLRYISDWRWRDEPADCPWYPTMRLFRQPDPDDFKTPVAMVATELSSLAAKEP